MRENIRESIKDGIIQEKIIPVAFRERIIKDRIEVKV